MVCDSTLGKCAFIWGKIHIPKVNRETNGQTPEWCGEVKINRDDKGHKKFSAVGHKNSHFSLAILWKIVFLLPTVNNEDEFCS